jgi:thiol-disulfide isomerase/thioredoxin
MPRVLICIFAFVLIAPAVLAQDREPVDDGQPAVPETKPETTPEAVPKAVPDSIPAAPPAKPEPEAEALSDDPGKAIIQTAAAAARAAKSISYSVRAYSTGKLAEMSPSRIQADVRMVRNDRGVYPPWLVRATGSGSTRATAGDIEFDVAWRSQTIEWVDSAEKKVLERRTREAKGTYFSIANNSRLDEVIAPQPYMAELKGEEFIVEAQQEIGGVLCDVVLVIGEGRRTKVRWAIGVEDHMPRRKERILESNIAGGTMVMEIENLTVSSEEPSAQARELLRVAVPEGFTEDRVEIAPPPPPVLPTPVEEASPGKIDEFKEATGKEGVTEAINNPPQPVAPATPAEPALTQGPDFELSAPDGTKVSLASLRGNVVILEFSGSWCLPCRDAHRELAELQATMQGKPVRIYMMAVREKDPDNAAAVLSKGGYTFGVLTGADATAKAYRVKTYPTYVVLGFDGEVLKIEGIYKKGETISGLATEITTYLESRK